MPHELLVTSRAHADISAAFEWYEQRVSGLGADFIRRLDTTISIIQQSPQLFRQRHGKMRMAMTTRFPFAVYFIWDESRQFISVRRVLHFSRNAPPQLQS